MQTAVADTRELPNRKASRTRMSMASRSRKGSTHSPLSASEIGRGTWLRLQIPGRMVS